MQEGGAARVTSLIANELVTRKYKIVIATNLSTQKISYYLDKRVIIENIYSATHSTDNRIKKVWIHISRLRSIIRLRCIDIIVGEQENGLIYAFYSNLFIGKPIIGHRHNTFKILGISNRQRRIFNLADCTVLLHNIDANYVKGKINNALAIYNPCSFTITRNFINKKKRITCVGSINRWHDKGFDIILNIWGNLSVQYPDWELYIVGGGPIEKIEHLQNIALANGIHDKVVFTGHVNNVDNYLLESEIFALPSRVEGFPMVLNEAISQGCACIVFELQGVVKELYSKDAVIIIEDNNVEEYSQQLKELIESPQKRSLLVSNAQNEIERYSIENITNEWVKLFDCLKPQLMNTN